MIIRDGRFSISSAGVKYVALFAVLVVLSWLFFPSVPIAEGAQMNNVSAVVEDATIYVSGDLQLNSAQLKDLEDGLDKEFIFYIDLFRVWDIWPDEFISGYKLIRKLKSDPVKKEYSLVSSTQIGNNEKRFNSLETLLSESLSLKRVPVVSTKVLLAGRYFVKVTVVSRIRKLAPIIGYLLFFVPEKEFDVEMDSDIINIQ